MKTTVFKILALACLPACFVSCKKSNDNNTPPKSKTVLLTQASWKLQSLGIDTDKNGTADQDMTSSVTACQLDNLYTFKTDSTGIMDESTLKCSSTDPQTKPFTWMFKSSETILSGTFSFSQGDATIISLTDTNLTVAYDDNLGTGTTYHLIAVLKH